MLCPGPSHGHAPPRGAAAAAVGGRPGLGTARPATRPADHGDGPGGPAARVDSDNVSLPLHVQTMNLIRIFLLGLQAFTCCQASWPFGGFYNVGNKRPLESKSEIDADLFARLTAVEKDAQEARKEAHEARKEAQKARTKAQEAREEAQEARTKAQEAQEAREQDSARSCEQFAAVEKKLLKVTAANRNFRIFAERFDEGQHRERRTAKVAEISKFIGATLVKMAELSMPVCNSWYEVAKSARGIHRSFLSDVEICDLTDENNVALKQPYPFQVPI